MFSNNKNSSGFTIVEIAVAVAILGIALTTLISLQTRMLDTYLNEKARTRAGFFGQYIMSLIEIDEAPEPGVDSGALRSKLEELGYFEENKFGIKAQDISSWNYQIETTSEAFQIIEDAYRRIDLTISWGESEEESFNLVYYVKSPTLEAAIRALSSTTGAGVAGGGNVPGQQ